MPDSNSVENIHAGKGYNPPRTPREPKDPNAAGRARIQESLEALIARTCQPGVYGRCTISWDVHDGVISGDRRVTDDRSER